VGTLKHKVQTTNPHLLEERSKKQMQWHFNNFQTRNPDSEQCLTQLYWLHSVRRAIFSAPAVSQDSLLTPFTLLTHFTRLSIWRNTSGALGGCLLVKQGKKKKPL